MILRMPVVLQIANNKHNYTTAANRKATHNSRWTRSRHCSTTRHSAAVGWYNTTQATQTTWHQHSLWSHPMLAHVHTHLFWSTLNT